MKVFFPNYHIAVNQTFVSDVIATGNEIYQPAEDWRSEHISFFASSEPNSRHITYQEWLEMPPMAVVIPCEQHIEDMKRAVAERGNIDTIIYLTAGANSVDTFPFDTDFLISHDLYYHRKSKAKYKMLYFNRPFVNTELREVSFEERFKNKQISVFINNLYKGGFEIEIPIIEEFKKLWFEKTGVAVKVYGYDNPDGWPQPPLTHNIINELMFVLSPKRRETFGQNVSEAMLAGVPCIFFESTLNSTFTEYLIKKDNSIIAKTAKEAVEKITNLSLEEYETLSMQAKTMVNLYCADQPRINQLKWFLSKIG
jgi:hypothetical protein